MWNDDMYDKLLAWHADVARCELRDGMTTWENFRLRAMSSDTC